MADQPKKTKVLYADDTALFCSNGDGRVEVVTLSDFEHAVDAVRDELRDERAQGRAIARLCGAYPGESTIAAVVDLVEAVECYRRLDRERPMLTTDTSIAVDDRVPTSLKPEDGWSSVGEAKIPSTGERIVVITHPGADGVLFVTEDAWECYEDARRCET